MHVRMLYPGDGAREVMKHDQNHRQHGGVGRLDNVKHRRDRSPRRTHSDHHLSAAMIYEAGKAIATFGIFTDLT
jgi:hypothetical protein